jgi:ribosome-binding protein aMBF1 (putative translation factor)
VVKPTEPDEDRREHEILGEFYREAREKSEMSVEEAAARAGLRVAIVRGIEDGTRGSNLRLKEMTKLAKTLGTEAADIVRRTEARLRSGG